MLAPNLKLSVDRTETESSRGQWRDQRTNPSQPDLEGREWHDYRQAAPATGELAVPKSLRSLAESYRRGAKIADMAKDPLLERVVPAGEERFLTVHGSELGHGHTLRIWERSV